MAQKLNVCLLNESFPPIIDGVANCILNYAHIIQRKHGKAIVAVPHYPDVVDDYPFDVVRYPSLDTTRTIGYRTGIPYWPSSIRELVKKDIDIIHTHCPFVSTLIARMLRAYINAPIILTYHTKFDIDINNAVELGFLRAAAIKFIVSNIEACDEVWVVSEGAGENLKSLGYKGDYVVMRNGTDFPLGRASDKDIANISGDYGLEDNVPVFLYVGRMMWYKNIRLILEGLAKAKNAGVRFKMLFVGGGADLDEINTLTSSLALTDDCVFTGPVNDRQKLRALYSRADLFVFPSTFDTNGLVVREAAACGLPSVLIRNSCAAEGIIDQRHGLIIDETAEALCNALIWASSHRAQMRDIGTRAKNEIYLSWEEAVDSAAARYSAVIEQYRQTHRRSALYLNKNLHHLITDMENAFRRLSAYRNGQIMAERRRLRLRLKRGK